MSKYIAISDARAKLPDLVDKADKNLERFVITVNGKPKGVLLSLEELESIEETAEILSSPKAKKDLRQGLKEAKQGLGIPFSDLE